MARQKAQQPLDIYLNGLLLGSLEYKAKSNLSFKYKPEWLRRSSAFPISRSLPLREDAYDGGKVFAYFDNLLPDGISIRQRVAARMRAKSDQVFDLLAVVGRDCVGALQFISPDEEPPVLESATGKPISEKQIANKLRNLKSVPLAASEEEDFRLSIAGAQEKTAFLKLKGKWCVPLGATPTTHIFKPQLGEIRTGLSFSDSVENEYLCAKIVSAFDIPTADCTIETFEDIKVLVVRRFDRAWNDQVLIRIPQEDLCQALSVPNFEKYQSDGGPGITDIMTLLNESQDREGDRERFIKSQVVFLLLAAIDGHAKNYSISWRPSGFRMTPLYDILSAQPLVDKGSFQAQKIKMAMCFGNHRHYKLREIVRRHLLETAKLSRFNLKTMNKVIDEVIDVVPKVISSVESQLDKSFPSFVAESIFKGLRERAEIFKASAD